MRFPSVKRFIENEKADPVAGFEKCRGRRVVGGAHGVVSGGLEQLDPALFSAVESRGAKRPVVVVDGTTGELDGPSVQQQTFFRRPGERPDAKGRLDLVDDLSTAAHLRYCSIQRR